MTPEQKEEFVLSLVAEAQRRAYLLATTRQPFAPDDYEAALSFTRNATYGLSAVSRTPTPLIIRQRFPNTWDRSPATSEWSWRHPLCRHRSGSNTFPVPEALLLSTNINKAGIITGQGTLLRSLRGAVNRPTVRKAWGIGGKQLDNLQDLFRRMKVKGYMRERSPSALRLIDELAEAVWKPELMKPKGFSEIDRLIVSDLNDLPKILGKNGQDLGTDGITMIFLPEADEIIAPRVRARLRSQGDYPSESIEAAVEACLERAQKRREEFADYVPEFEAWKADSVVNDGGIPVDFNLTDNGLFDPNLGGPESKRAFDFQRIEREGKEIFYVPKMAGKDGKLKYISGDTDFVHFSFLNGDPLDPDTARKLYAAMARCCGLQHPETITWILKGQTVFKGKLNQLSEYLTGAKALLEIGGDSLRAVHMKAELTRFAKNGRDHLIFFDSGLKSRQRALSADIESAFAYAKSLFPSRKVVIPFLRASRFNEALQNAGKDGWTYSTQDNEAVLLREDSGGAFQIYDGSNWIPWIPNSGAWRNHVGTRSATTLGLTPTSSLSEAAWAGETRIAITNLPARWPTELAGHVDGWFAPGQTIVIEPGEITQEVITIAPGSETTLTQPLKYNHPPNAMVAVVPGNLTVSPIPAGSSKLISVAEDRSVRSVTLVWESISGRAYQLQAPGTSGNWENVGGTVGADGPVVSVTLASSTFQPQAGYRLLDVGPIVPGVAINIRSFTVQPGGGSCMVSWTSESGAVYQIEDSGTLAENSWQPVGGTITATSTLTSANFPLSSSDKKRFFRVTLVSRP